MARKSLATLKAEKHRVEMPHEGSQCRGCQHDRAGMQGMCYQYRYQSLEHVTDQRQRRGLLATQARDIGCARVA